MRRIELLITQCRTQTDNSDFTESAGISDAEFVQAANDAQDDLFEAILDANSDLYLKEKEIDAVSGQETYNIPSDCFLGSRLEKVEYSASGLPQNYYWLKKGKLSERYTGSASNPAFYIRRDTQFLLQPKPQGTGKIRLTYVYKIPRLDVKSGTVLSASTSGLSLTSLTLDPTTLTSENIENLQDAGFLTVVGSDGSIKMKGIPVSSIDMSTGVVTFGAHTFESGEVITAGNFVVPGALSTHISRLPDNCERYLLSYMAWRIYRRDSSGDAGEQNQELKEMRAQIASTFASPDTDVNFVTILDDQYLTSDGW